MTLDAGASGPRAHAYPPIPIRQRIYGFGSIFG